MKTEKCPLGWASFGACPDSKTGPSIPFLYEPFDRAKEMIHEACASIKRKYMPKSNLIDTRWSSILHWDTHAAACYLNPRTSIEIF